jgi:molecular chaperone GrpE
MAQEKLPQKEASSSEKPGIDKNGVPPPSLFRLPRFFTQGADVSADETIGELEEDTTVRIGADTAQSNVVTAKVQPAQAQSPAQAQTQITRSASEELASLRDEIERLTEQVTQVNERESALERVFDALHSELADYKNDFLYEHLKPVVRPLLFLFDSIEQFDSEIAMASTTMGNKAQTAGVLAPVVVQENVAYFRDQLIEALRVCEVTIMESPRGAFNPKFHKAVDVMPVSAEEDGTIVKVVRSGWFLNGQLLRPADVVVGKYRGQ